MKAGIAIAALLTLTVVACMQTAEPAEASRIARAPIQIIAADPETAEAALRPTPDPPQSELTATGVFPEPTPEPEPEPVYETADDGWTYYGTCTITHYCTGHCCNGPYTGTASGAPLTPYRTCASGQLPFGTEVLVNGEVWVVEDTGVQGMWLDLCVSSHEEAIQRGMFDAEVYIR